MRRSIGLKIFAIAAFLLALMIAASILTTRRVRDTGREIDSLAHYLIPLANRVVDVQVAALEQQVVFERLLRLLAAGSRGDEALAEEQGRFDQHGAAVDRLVEEATALAEQGLASVVDENREALIRLEPQLGALEQEHQHFEDLARQILGAAEAGEDESAARLGAMAAKEEAEYEQLIEDVLEEIDGFTEAASGRSAEAEHSVYRFSLTATGLAVLVGLFFAVRLTQNLVRPIRSLVHSTKEISAGRLNEEIPILSGDEIGDLARAVDEMREEILLKERIKDTFGKYLDPRVVEGLLGAEGRELALGAGEKREISVFFSDLVGFTSIGERLTPDVLVRLLNEYLTFASRAIVDRSGVVDKYIGDAILAFWGTPFVKEGEQARLACLAALDQFPKLEEFRARLPDLMGLRRDLPTVDFRVGIATGEAVVGNIGSEMSKSYTVIGDTVNLGSRLEGANKAYGTRILICDRTRECAGDAVEVREVDVVRVVGKKESVRVFELLGRAGELDDDTKRLREVYSDGLAAYRSRDWDAAEKSLEECLAVRPEDGPSLALLSRLSALRAEPPAEDWDGSRRLDSK